MDIFNRHIIFFRLIILGGVEVDEHLQELIEFKERCKSNTKRIDEVEHRLDKNEEVLGNIDKSLSVTIEQIKNIAEDLKTTSVNFKEAIMRSNTANSKETELLKEKYNELEKKYEKLSSKLEQETIGRDAKNWRDSKSKIISWAISIVLAIIAGVLGLSKFL